MAMALSSTAVAATLARRCFSSTLARAGSLNSSCGYSNVNNTAITNKNTSCSKYNYTMNHSNRSNGNIGTIRSFSMMPPPPAAAPPGSTIQPPTSLTPEAGLGAQDAMKLFIQHGLGKQKLQQIAADKPNSPLVDRWQKMVMTYLETQCHVIALLGYRPDEQGISQYTQHLSQALQLSSPDIQEKLRVAGRDTYRMVLGAAFDMPNLMEEQNQKGELSVVDARNIMHKVSLRMQSPEVLEKVAKKCSVSVAMNDSPEAQQIEMAHKHTMVQEVMVKDVYLTTDTKEGTLVKECGFGDGEDGYVRMQSAMAEHQGDPLITQYVGAAMMKLLESAGIDMGALQKQAQAQHQQQGS